MSKWIRWLAVFVVVAIFARVGIALAYNTTTERLENIPQAQYSQITSMNAELKKVAQTEEVCVAIRLMGQGNIQNVEVDYVSYQPDYNTHFHSHYYLDSSNIIVGREDSYRTNRTEANFSNVGAKKTAYVTATGVKVMQGSNWPLAQTITWTPGVSYFLGGLKAPRSLPPYSGYILE
jgi:hypothetical protein